MRAEEKDDRPIDNISFAATNLVKPGMQSRRQQSEPPVSRNVFPPTPPPESERGPSRGASVRSGPKPAPAKLTIQTQDANRRYEKAPSPQDGRPRPARSASATPARGYSNREPVQRRPSRPIEEEVEVYPEEVYDMYQTGAQRQGGRTQQTRPRQQGRYIEEEEASDYDDGSFDEGDFEMLPGRRNAASMMSGSSRGASRRPDVRKIRVKVHADSDVRYLLVGAAVEFPDLADRVRDKFGLKRRFKIKVKDEDVPDGDMITMGDQDDLDMAVMTAKSVARKTRQEIGKMEVCFPLMTIS